MIKYKRKNKKMLSVYIDKEFHAQLVERAKFRNLKLSQWIAIAIMQRIEEEDKYL